MSDSLAIQLPDDLVAQIAARVVEMLDAKSPGPDPWLTVDQAAVYLACGRQRIYNLVSQRRLRHAKDGSRVLFRRVWLDELMENVS